MTKTLKHLCCLASTILLAACASSTSMKSDQVRELVKSGDFRRAADVSAELAQEYEAKAWWSLAADARINAGEYYEKSKQEQEQLTQLENARQDGLKAWNKPETYSDVSPPDSGKLILAEARLGTYWSTRDKSRTLAYYQTILTREEDPRILYSSYPNGLQEAAKTLASIDEKPMAMHFYMLSLSGKLAEFGDYMYRDALAFADTNNFPQEAELLRKRQISTQRIKGLPALKAQPNAVTFGDDSRISGVKSETYQAVGEPSLARLYADQKMRYDRYINTVQRSAQAAEARAAANQSSSQSGSSLMAMVGAISQGAASAGGKNADKWQAVANASQAASGTPAEQLQAVMKQQAANQTASANNNNKRTTTTPANGTNATAMTGTTSPSTSPTAGGSTSTAKDPFIYSAAVNECLVVEDHPTLVGTKGLRNRCGYKINYTFCEYNKGSDGAINDECRKGVFGANGLAAGERTYLVADTKHIEYIACKDPYYIPGSKLTWDGAKLTGKCQMAR